MAYQALVHSVMRIDRLGRFGALGQEAQCTGDLSGGYQIRMHDYASQPIVDRLGLHIAREEWENGVRVLTLRPITPFAMEADVSLPVGTVLASRTVRSAWQIGGAADGAAAACGPCPAPNPYNEALQPAVPCLRGPLVLRGAKIYVLPLQASPEALARVCSTYYAGTPAIEPVGSTVYLLVTVGEEQQAGGRPTWTTRQASFYFPVTRGTERSYVAPFLFMGDDVSQVTARELHGSNATLAEITGSWAQTPAPGGSLLAVRTMGWPLINHDLQARSTTLVEIVAALESVAPATPDGSSAPAPVAGPPFAVLVAASEGKLPFTVIDIKQYRDATAPEYAAYQAMVRWHGALLRVGRQENVPPVTVRIHDDANHAVARVLGLAPGPGTVELRAIDPFCVTADLGDHPGRDAPGRLAPLSRARALAWGARRRAR